MLKKELKIPSAMPCKRQGGELLKFIGATLIAQLFEVINEKEAFYVADSAFGKVKAATHKVCFKYMVIKALAFGIKYFLTPKRPLPQKPFLMH